MKLVLLLCFFLLQVPAAAQITTVTGRVFDRSNGQGLPGTTILQLNTVNGISTNTDGSFSLTVPGPLDSVTLSISTIGYVKQQRRVAAGSYSEFSLSADKKELCDLSINPSWEIGLMTGLCYAPMGTSIHFLGSRVFPIPLDIQVDYQTNLRKNYAGAARWNLPTLFPYKRVSFTETLTYQQLRAESANVRFRSYTATLGVSIYRIGEVRVPDLLLGAGYAKYRPLQYAAETAAADGYGYSLGLRYNLPRTLWAEMQVQATRWPGYWQLQGSLRRQVFGKFSAGVAYSQLLSYREVSLTLTRFFY